MKQALGGIESLALGIGEEGERPVGPAKLGVNFQGDSESEFTLARLKFRQRALGSRLCQSSGLSPCVSVLRTSRRKPI
jgi:hypothetical protein